MQTNQTSPSTFSNITEYIAGFPAEVQEILQKIRRTIRDAAPEADEAISYQLPTFKLKGKNIIHFAAFPNHIGIYPTPSAIDQLQEELTPYRTGKGTLQFPLDQPIPYHLITKIVELRIIHILESTAAKTKKRKS